MTDRIAVLIPCYNEEASIAQVVGDFRQALPEAEIFVYDNNSRDRTAEVAAAAGAVVRQEHLQGKGNVVRRMFADIEADIYVLVDGDATYHAASVPGMIDKLHRERLDMVNGARVSDSVRAYRPGHRFGNRLLSGIVIRMFGERIRDMLSGYRVFSRRFVKSFPGHSSGFEIETELTVHALVMRLPIGEVETPYAERPEGSVSKLNTYRDGLRILGTITRMVQEERPMLFFLMVSVLLALAALGLGIPVVLDWLETGLVPRLPTAVLSASLMILAFLSFTCGVILETVTKGRREARRLAYLQVADRGPR